MRIGVNTLFLIPGEVGGSETYLCETLRAMAAQAGTARLVLFTNRENDAVLRERLAGAGCCEFVCLGFRAADRYSRIIREQTHMPFAVRRAGVDVLWSPGYTAVLCSRCPQVVTIHDMQYKRYPEDLTSIARWATDVLVRLAARRCQAVVAVSQFSKSEILRFTSASPERVRVVPEGVDPAFGVPMADGALRKRVAGILGFDGPYVLCVSNTYPHKNVPCLVRSFGGIAGLLPHRLVIVGRPRLGEPLVKEAIAEAGISDRVVRIEYAGKSDLIGLYQAADVFAFPSLYEGFGLPVVEAMLARVPVVTTSEGSLREVGGECVVRFDPQSADDLSAKLLDVLGWDGARRRAWTDRGAAHAGRYSWDQAARLTLECLQDAARRRRSA